MIGISLPILFIVAVELVRPIVVDRLWPDQGHLVLGGLAALAALAFGVAIFSSISYSHSLVVRQNRELAAVNAVSTAVRGDLDVEQIIDAALRSLLEASGALEASLTVSAPLGRTLDEDVAVRRRQESAPDQPDDHGRPTGSAPRTLEIPLRAGTADVGTMSLTVARDSGPELLSSGALENIGREVGSAIQRAQLIAHLQRGRREGHAIYQVLLQISHQDSPAATLVSVVAFARDLLDADDAGLCLDQTPSGLAPLDAAAEPPATGVPVCISAEAAGACSARMEACPIRTPGRHQALTSVALRGRADPLGRLWVARSDPFSLRDERFLDTLAELAVVALDRARMLENERQGAMLAERERIAREMHDSLAQVLGVTHLRLRALGALPEVAASAAVRGEVVELAGLCQEAYHDVREAILGLRESSRTDRPLLESLAAYVEKFSRQSGVATTLDCTLSRELALSPQCEVQVIRVIQESLTNVRKHSGARSATVRISEAADSTLFVVEDDGHGFDPGAVPADREGFGLRTMHERMRLVHGKVTVDSAPGRGTRVQVTVPCPQPAALPGEQVTA